MAAVSDALAMGPLVLLYFCGANSLGLGLIVLIVGFGDLSRLTTARTRKGLLVKLAGANLLIVAFGLFFFSTILHLQKNRGRIR
jgi:hypothetical protein